VLGSARTLTATTRQHITNLPKVASQIVALGLLNVLRFGNFFFFEKCDIGLFIAGHI